MEESKKLLEEIEAEEKRLKESAAENARRKNKVYESLAIAVIVEIFKFRDGLKESFKIFQGVNTRLAELESLYPGYISFLQKSDSWESDFEAAEVQYITGYLLSGKWRPDAGFWPVVSQIADTISQKGNLFKEVTDG